MLAYDSKNAFSKAETLEEHQFEKEGKHFIMSAWHGYDTTLLALLVHFQIELSLNYLAVIDIHRETIV